MIQMKNVSKVYRTEHVETHALSSFTVDIAAGEFVAIVGPMRPRRPRREAH